MTKLENKVYEVLKAIASYIGKERVNGNTSLLAQAVGCSEPQVLQTIKQLGVEGRIGGVYREGDGFYSAIVYDVDDNGPYSNIPMLIGSIEMNSEAIRESVWDNMPGYYVLEEIEGHTRRPRYIGRSDTNLREELIARISKGYPLAEFFYTPSAEQAYYAECALYHGFCPENLTNENHPAMPKGVHIECPYCKHGFGQRINLDPNQKSKRLVKLLRDYMKRS